MGERIVAILEHGQRQSTYKLAALSALIEYCVAHVPDEPGATLDVPIEALADEVMRLYWQQVLPFPKTETACISLRRKIKSPCLSSAKLLGCERLSDRAREGLRSQARRS
jgi:hypothetical protein